MSSILFQNSLITKDPGGTVISSGSQIYHFLGAVAVALVAGETQITVGGGGAVFGTAGQVAFYTTPGGALNTGSTALLFDNTNLRFSSQLLALPGMASVVVAAGFTISNTRSNITITSAGPVSSSAVTAITAGLVSGEILSITNSGAFPITFVNSLNTRCPFGVSFVLNAGASVNFKWSAGSTSWRCIGASEPASTSPTGTANTSAFFNAGGALSSDTQYKYTNTSVLLEINQDPGGNPNTSSVLSLGNIIIGGGNDLLQISIGNIWTATVGAINDLTDCFHSAVIGRNNVVTGLQQGLVVGESNTLTGSTLGSAIMGLGLRPFGTGYETVVGKFNDDTLILPIIFCVSIGTSNVTRQNGFYVDTNGDATIHRQLKIKEGANKSMGRAVLVGGTLVVANTLVTAASEIFLTSQIDGGTPGFLRVSARVVGTSFTILSSNALDTSTVAWLILGPGV